MNKNRTKSLFFSIFKYVMLVLAAVIAVIPVVVCVFTAFKTEEEYQTTSALTLPKSFLYFENFKVAFTQANMLRGFFNTALVLVVVLAASVLVSSMIAYVLNRFKFVGNGLIRNLFMFAALLPGIAMQVTIYEIMNSLHLINHLYGYMICLMGTDIISIYIFLQFFENLSTSLDESAIIDGCTYFGVFFKILLPLLKPAIMTTLVLKGVGVYNEYYAANLYLQSKELKTISTALYTFTGPYGSQYNYICAGVLITIIPILIIFVVFQKQVYGGLASGAVKG
ncbi:MAG: carbohydrate ABC transporter permease [Lachnospiraceae bacterium]|nr:carbohydrate ABC transporter permease [Lachnospiraceae bacterium]